MAERYRAWPDRADLLMCQECSSRTQVALIPADERQEHDDWHAEQLEWSGA